MRWVCSNYDIVFLTVLVMDIDKNPIDLVKSWSDEFRATSNRIRSLIGRSHWLSDGKHKEAILSGFLKKYTNNKYIYSTGFIVPFDNISPSSGEVDIVVSCSDSGLPWFNDSGLIIVPPEMVKAHIHVKSSYRKDSLVDVFTSIEKANVAISKSGINVRSLESIWSCGFFFDENFNSINTLLDNVVDIIENLEDWNYLPNSIYIHPNFSVNINRNNREVEVVCSKNEDLVVPMFLASFYECVGGISSTDLGDLLYCQVSKDVVSKKIVLDSELSL